MNSATDTNSNTLQPVATTTTAEEQTSSPQQQQDGTTASSTAAPSCGVEAKQGTAPVVNMTATATAVAGKKRSLEEATTADDKSKVITSISPESTPIKNKRAKQQVAAFTTAADLLLKKEETLPTKKQQPPKKKKKKKFSNLLKGMMQASTEHTVKREQEREALKKHLGGGKFQKVDKI